MNGVNKALLIGRLGQKPEVRYTQGGQAVCNFTMATTETWGSGEERKERTEWHRIVIWGRRGEIAAEYLDKGRLVYIEGRIQTRKWQDKDGNNRYTTEIVARDFQFLEPKNATSGGGGSAFPPPPGDDDYVPDPMDDDDIPF